MRLPTPNPLGDNATDSRPQATAQLWSHVPMLPSAAVANLPRAASKSRGAASASSRQSLSALASSALDPNDPEKCNRCAPLCENHASTILLELMQPPTAMDNTSPLAPASAAAQAGAAELPGQSALDRLAQEPPTAAVASLARIESSAGQRAAAPSSQNAKPNAGFSLETHARGSAPMLGAAAASAAQQLGSHQCDHDHDHSHDHADHLHAGAAGGFDTSRHPHRLPGDHSHGQGCGHPVVQHADHYDLLLRDGTLLRPTPKGFAPCDRHDEEPLLRE